MVSERPSTSRSANSAARESSDLGRTQAGGTSHDSAAKNAPNSPDDIYQGQSITRVALVLISAFMSMFLVALDKTIISTV